jgi:HlyD family secretion protein
MRPERFSPELLRLEREAPQPLGRAVLWTLLALLAGVLGWAALGRLDIVAVAEGKLVPHGFLKIVQPAEQGIVREILVREGEAVRAGQVLMRMDSVLTDADGKTLRAEFHSRRLALRRIDAQLAGRPFAREADDPVEIHASVLAQYEANRRAYENALAQEKSVLEKARHDLTAAEEVRAKLERVLPHYRQQEQVYAKLVREGFMGELRAAEKERERIEKEQDLKTQQAAVRAARALIEQSQSKMAQIAAEYQRQLRTERVEAAAQLEKARQELAKQEHRRGLLELTAPHDGFVKDLATHTPGTVASPGTILMTLVPHDERLRAEVWVGNQDAGFVRSGQPVKVKLAAFQFQKYGMVAGEVEQVSADASELPAGPGAALGPGRAQGPVPLAYRAFVSLAAQELETDGKRYRLAPGMQVSAEIHLGTRTVLEYLLSPLQKAFHEAGRER